MTRATRFFLAVITVVGALSCRSPVPDDADTVVLVHGLGRSPASMIVLEQRLERAGYKVENVGYPSTTETLEVLVDSLASAVESCCSERPGKVHFVTHSMGGVLVRSYLAAGTDISLGRVVMLAPPNQGSEIIDAFRDSRLLRLVLGPTGMELGTDTFDIPARLREVDFELGVITGDRSTNPIGSWLIPGPDDGMVGVAAARIEGASDFVVVSATHTFIMNRADVADLVVRFLEEGRFE